MERLKLEEWTHLIPDSIGKIRTNHVGSHCEGGRDSMIVERKEDGTANAYCFRCGASGYYSPTRYFKSPSKTNVHGSGSPPVYSASVPKDAHDSFPGFPREAREWLIRGGVTSVISGERGVLWSESTERLYIPVGDGWVVRGFSPKYYRVMGGIKYGYYPSEVINNKCVIVEDTLSAWKTSQVIDSIALLGSKMKWEVVSKILEEKYELVYIWLDNDNTQVKMGARKIVKQLPFVETKVINTDKDPKYYSIEQIKEYLK